MTFEVGDIVIMETNDPPLPEHFVIWRVTDASDQARLGAEVVGNDLVRSAALEKGVKAARDGRVFWYSRAKDTFFQHHSRASGGQ